MSVAVGLPAANEVESEAPFEAPLMPDMPPSWVPKLRFSQEMMDMRCPKGIRTTQYWRCQHEIFAIFGETSRWDGLSERLTIYQVSGSSAHMTPLDIDPLKAHLYLADC